MNNSWALIRAIRGPLILIAVGVLFAMDQGGVLPFTRSWPLLIILVGILKLVERVAAPPAPHGPYAQGPYPAPPVPPAPPQSAVQTPGDRSL